MNSRPGRRTIVPPAAPKCNLCRRVPPALSCPCRQPPVLICSECLVEHIYEAGNHKPVRLNSAPRQSMPGGVGDERDPEFTRPVDECAICGESADKICCCQFPPKKICSGCIDDHSLEPSQDSHLQQPLSAAVHLQTNNALKQMRRRINQKMQAFEKLQEVFQEIGKAEEEIVTAYQELSNEINQAKYRQQHNLEQMRDVLKTSIDKAMQEVSEHIYESDYEPTTSLASQIFHYEEANSEALLSIFKCKIELEKATLAVRQLANLRLNLTRIGNEDGNGIQTKCLPVVNSTSIRLYNTETLTDTLTPKSSQLLSESILIGDSSSWLMLRDGHIFACGNLLPLSASAYDINTETGKVEHRSPMQTPRNSHGIGLHERINKIYVFGGKGTGENFLKSCEIYDLLLDIWTVARGSMRDGRACFNPVLYEEKFFLAGGQNSKHVELFSVVSESVTQMQVELPYSTSTTAVADGEDLLILQKNKLLRWKIMAKEKPVEVTVNDGFHMYSTVPPIRVESDLVLLRCVNGKILKVGLGKVGRTQAVKCEKFDFIY